MNEREEVARMIQDAMKIGNIHERTLLLLAALQKHVAAFDADLQKMRKELRTRNGVENG